MKKMMAISLLVLMLAVGTVLADERCNDSQNVAYGDSMKEVLSKCGDPADVVNWYNGFNQLVEQEFIYNLGEGQFPRHFFFNYTGRVVRISIGSKRQ